MGNSWADIFDSAVKICTAFCSVALFIGWGIITYQRIQEGRKYYVVAVVIYAVTYLMIFYVNYFLPEHREVWRCAIYVLQTYGTYDIINLGRIHRFEQKHQTIEMYKNEVEHGL